MKNNPLSRMTVDIPTALYKMLKTRAIREDKSLREVIIECLEASTNEYTECPYDHIPNAETQKAIEEAKKGKGKVYHAKDAYELFEQCGIPVKRDKK